MIICKRQKLAAALLPQLFGTKVPGHTTRAPPVGFKLATNCIQLYAIANLDKTLIEGPVKDIWIVCNF